MQSGSKESEQFYGLTPDRVLQSVEQFGVRCTGRCLALNSMENRVFELELDTTPPEFRVAKFYRPGRWSLEQLEAEHQFLRELADADVPVIAPLEVSPSAVQQKEEQHRTQEKEQGEVTSSSTIRRVPDLGVYLALFPKARGRNPEDLTDEQFEWIGRLIARMHLVGARHPAPARLQLTAETFVFQNLEFLLSGGFLPPEVRKGYVALAHQLESMYANASNGAQLQRIHGDCHRGNILWGPEGPFFVDFDDMVMGPVVQDLWLLISELGVEGQRQLEMILSGYEQMRAFDRGQLKLIEGLRGLRYVNYSAWIARRWEDPMFKRVFQEFGTVAYWQGQMNDLREQIELFGEALSQT